MSGRGKGDKMIDKGKCDVKRHKKVLRDKILIQGISIPEIRSLGSRLACTNDGAICNSHEEKRVILKEFLRNIIRDAGIYADYARRIKITAVDVVFALKRQVSN